MDNTGITLTDVRSEAMDSIRQLKSKEIDIQTAKAIKGFLDTIVETAKTQVGFLNSIPKSIKEKMSEENIKAIAGTLRDRDAELDDTLTKIDKNQSHYIINNQ